MSKKNLAKTTEGIRLALAKHSPEILTGLGIGGLVTSTVLAVRATPKALTLINERKAEERKKELKPLEVVQATWTCYIPAAVTSIASIACIIGASSVHAHRNAVLAAAYALSETSLKEYQEKVVETIGEKKDKAVREAIAKDKLDSDPVNSKEVILTNRGETLCYDVISGRYFKSDIDKIKKAENALNRQLIEDMYVPLNDFYYEIGLSSIKLGDDLGWALDKGLINIEYSTQLAEDGTPCLVINYSVAPNYNYFA